MEKVTIDIEEMLATGMTEVKNPEKDSYVWIDDTVEIDKERRREKKNEDGVD